MSTQSDIAEKKEKALLELMGPQSDLEDKAKLAMTKHFENNGNVDSNDLVLLGDIINDNKQQKYFNSIKKNKRKTHSHSNMKNSQEDIEMNDLTNENKNSKNERNS